MDGLKSELPLIQVVQDAVSYFGCKLARRLEVLDALTSVQVALGASCHQFFHVCCGFAI